MNDDLDPTRWSVEMIEETLKGFTTYEVVEAHLHATAGERDSMERATRLAVEYGDHDEGVRIFQASASRFRQQKGILSRELARRGIKH